MTESNNGSLLLIGGNLICNTMYKRDLLSAITVEGILAGNSPFALACGESDLEAFLQAHPAEFLILDLHYVCQPLLTDGEKYYTKTVAQADGLTPISIDELPEERKKSLISDYADVLMKYFKSENIALINTVKSEFFAVKNRVRMQENGKFNKLLEECEGYFHKRTGCICIDTLKFYYMEKKVAGMQYESEAYADLADNVRRFVRRQHVRKRPIFRYSLDRYCRYYNNLYKRAFGAFLRTNNAVENLVYSSTPQFVKKHYELLRAAEKLLISDYCKLAESLDLTIPDAQLLKDILLAMDATIKKDYVNPEVRYDLLFENHITVRALWQDMRKYAAAHWKKPFSEQITEANYGYYFSLMQMELTDDKTVCERARKTLQRMQVDESVNLLPTAVDFWGSCVSRLAFQYDNVAGDYNLVFRGNLFQALPVFLDAPAVSYNPLLFMPPITAENKVVQYELDGTLRQQLDETGSDWVVVDLYTLTALSLFRHQGKVYCDNQNFCSKKLGATKCTLHKEFSEEEIFAELDRFAEYLCKRYGEKIILVKHKRMEYYLDFEGKLKRFGQKECADSAERNPFNDRYVDYFARRSGCYYIDIVDQFVSDEMNLLYLNTVHYESEFYTEVCKLMRYIIDQRPSRRHFTSYDSLTKLRRMAKLTASGAEKNVIAKLFSDSWLDKRLIELPPEVLRKNAQILAHLCDENCSHLASAKAYLTARGETELAALLAGGQE